MLLAPISTLKMHLRPRSSSLSFFMKSIPALLCLLLFSAFGNHIAAQKNKAEPIRAWNHGSLPAPKGMEYIPGGTIIIKYGAGAQDSFNTRMYSLSPFFMDKTEVTNAQYRQFLNWVIDSVAVTQFLKDSKYFYKNNSDSNQKRINWSKVKHRSLFGSNSKKTQNALQPMYKNGEIKPELYNFVMTYTLSKPGNKRNGTRTTEAVNVYPDTRTWATDFPNSQTDMMVQQYFSNPAWDDYPVVGITWKQARAYAKWRSMVNTGKSSAKFMRKYNLPYALPSEAQWVHAALGMNGKSSDTSIAPQVHDLSANYKQNEGVYTEDGASYTVPVKSYAPNQFGLYNMLGNASEWVLDAYNQSAWAFAHDQNPVILYDADSTEVDFMKAKVFRGGSWKDKADEVSPNYRNFDGQDVPHSYIGFRCVMPAPEVITKQVQTRKR